MTLLSRLVIKNFKSIGEQGVDLELRPLTFLVGPNGSGKSSVLEALALIAQSMESDSAQAQGRLVNFLSLLDISHRRNAELVCEIAVGTESAAINFPFSSSNNQFEIATSMPSMPPELQECFADIADLFKSGTYFLPAKTRVDYWSRPEGQTLITRLKEMWALAQYRKQRVAIDKWCGALQIANVWVEQPSASIVYEDLDTSLDIRLSSLGSTQAFPIIVRIADANPGSLLLIEEPEISLHPQAQVVMSELLATAASERKQIIATTHSTFLLLGLRKVVTKGIIKAESIAVYEISKGPKGSTATPLQVREEGYIEGWVPSFGEVEKELLRGWLDVIPKAE